MSDPDSSSTLQILLFIVCILLSCFFSASETALTTINKVRLRGFADGGSRRAQQVTKLLEHPDKVLTSILVMNNFINISASALSTTYAIRVFGNQFVGIATGVVTLLILMFGEITPKTIAVRYNVAISMAVAVPVRFFVFILSPVVFLLNKVALAFLMLTGSSKHPSDETITEEEIITMVNMSHEQGLLETEERHMIRNVFEFGDGTVREVMTPRVNVVMADVDWTYQQVIEVFREHQFTRMPVYRESPDEIIGIVNLKDILLEENGGSEFSLEKLLRPANFVYEFNNISKVFAHMRKEHTGLSVVLDEYGIMSGVVTMEDFIEEIVGEIDDEYDEVEEELIHKVGEEYMVDGTLSIDTFNEAVGADLHSEEFESVGGFLLGLASTLPGEGTTLYHDGIAFTVEKVDANRIETIRVRYETAQTVVE